MYPNIIFQNMAKQKASAEQDEKMKNYAEVGGYANTGRDRQDKTQQGSWEA